jgi:hypothetical protein
MKFIKIQIIAILVSLSVGVASAIPVEVEQSGSLKISSEGETLFEVAELEPAALQSLLKWLGDPPAKVSISADGAEILGLPVKVVVTPAIAKRWNSEPKNLAQLFSKRLNEILGDSTPRWDVSSQVVPLNESRVVKLSPFRPEAGLSVRTDNPSVLGLEDLGNGRFRLQGVSRGRAAILVDSVKGTSISPLPISVKPWAAQWGDGPGRLSFWGPSSDARVKKSLNRWLSARAFTGARVALSEWKKDEKTGAVTVLAQASSDQALAVEKKLVIDVQDYKAEVFRPAGTVVLSNHPERIVSEGILFQRRTDATPFRFMWHHRNDPAGPDRFLVLQLSNPTSVTRRLRVLWYSYGPSPDEIHVGHTAALDYSQAGIMGLGEELVLPANGTRTVEIRHVKAGQTMSGMAYIGEASGSAGPLEVIVSAADSSGSLPTESALNRDPGRTASGVFPAAIETVSSHVLGGPFTYLECGGEPYGKDVEHSHPSYGNFGTVYRTRLLLKNPSSEPKEAAVGFASGGGAARGVLSLDGELYDLPMGVTGDGLPVRRYSVQPGEVVQVDVELFPQAGSNYPIRIVVKSDFARLPGESLQPLRALVPRIP